MSSRSSPELRVRLCTPATTWERTALTFTQTGLESVPRSSLETNSPCRCVPWPATARPAPYLPVSDGKTGAGVSRSDDSQARSPAPAGARAAREMSSPPVTASGYVMTQIRDGILSGAFPLGSRLDQQVLADEMGVSTIPVREALRHL